MESEENESPVKSHVSPLGVLKQISTMSHNVLRYSVLQSKIFRKFRKEKSPMRSCSCLNSFSYSQQSVTGDFYFSVSLRKDPNNLTRVSPREISTSHTVVRTAKKPAMQRERSGYDLRPEDLSYAMLQCLGYRF